ncbi:MAG: LuxR C-terminal-related transcriptional regulator [Flavobacteriales bacterium]
MRERRTLAVVDGQPIYRKGLVATLKELGYRVRIVASSWEDHINQSARQRPDLVVVKVAQEPEAFAFIAWLCKEQRVPVLSICPAGDRQAQFRAIRAGARALVDSDADEHVLGPALRDLLTAGIHCNQYMEEFLHGAGRMPDPAPVPAGEMIDSLTDRERQVFRWLLHVPRLTLLSIGKRLGRSRSTMATHVENIAAKLGVRGRVGILYFAWQNNITLAADKPVGIAASKKAGQHDTK